MSEHEHEWHWDKWRSECEECYSESMVPVAVCRCGAYVGAYQMQEIINNSTVKTIINVVIARRDDDEV